MRLKYPVRSVLVAALLVMAPGLALASYLGPGLGLGLIGTAFGVVAAVVLGIASILWYPVKRLVRRLRPATAGRPLPRAGD